MGKPMSSLLEDPDVSDTDVMDDAPPVTPYDKAFSMLSAIRGPKMQLMTRGNPKMAEAAKVAHIYACKGSKYASDIMDIIYRFGAGLNGEARKEFVDSLKSMGASMPDAFFDGGSSKGAPESWVDIPQEEE